MRLKAARNLQKFVSTELRELPAEAYSKELDEINQNIFGLMSSPELHEKKGGVLAIGEFAESALMLDNVFVLPNCLQFIMGEPHCQMKMAV